VTICHVVKFLVELRHFRRPKFDTLEIWTYTSCETLGSNFKFLRKKGLGKPTRILKTLTACRIIITRRFFLVSIDFWFFELSTPPATLWWIFKEIIFSQNWFSSTVNTLSTKWKKSETIDFKKVLSYSKSTNPKSRGTFLSTVKEFAYRFYILYTIYTHISMI
jgi:hypothetical protein